MYHIITSVLHLTPNKKFLSGQVTEQFWTMKVVILNGIPTTPSVLHLTLETAETNSSYTKKEWCKEDIPSLPSEHKGLLFWRQACVSTILHTRASN